MIVQDVEYEHAGDKGEPRTEVHQPGHGSAESVLALEYAGECGKQQVHHSKYQGHVKGYDKEDRRPKQEHSRSNKYLDDNLMWGERVSGKLRAKMMVSGVSAETGSFAL